MTQIELSDGRIRLDADDGLAICERGTGTKSAIVSAIVNPSSVNDWMDCEFGEPEGEAMKYSRWGIIKALEKRGLADAFDAYLEANKAAFRRFYGPQFFAADDADFKDMLKTMQAAFKLSDEDITAILAESPYTPE